MHMHGSKLRKMTIKINHGDTNGNPYLIDARQPHYYAGFILMCTIFYYFTSLVLNSTKIKGRVFL